jgi:multidrug efflux pump subunit AcrA (membrane-fusion protein)
VSRLCLTLSLLAALTGCDAAKKTAAGDAAEGATQTTLKVDDTVTGFVSGRHYSTLRAPENVFRLAGWNSTSSWTKIVFLAKEGARVKKGDIVARFAFNHKKALFWVKDRIRKAQAESSKKTIEHTKSLRELVSLYARSKLTASSARLDTLKKGLVSRRQLSLFRIAHRQAAFEADALHARIRALKAAMKAESAYYKQRVDREATLLRRYHRHKRRYAVRAPHDGVVRYAYYRRRRRKIKKGDGMLAGTPVVLLAKDERLAVRCFVPEHRVKEAVLGRTVTVLSGGGRLSHSAEIVEIERFPQEMGFLMKNKDLPNARQKAYVVIAELPVSAKLAAGNEVRVRLGRNGKVD